MPETSAHDRLKRQAAGKGGEIEKPLPDGRRIDAATGKKATEVERSGSAAALQAAAQRLKASGKLQKVLQVPQQDMGKAADAMRKAGTKGTVKNLTGTRRRSVN